MMKSTILHIKFESLLCQLNLKRWQAVGLLESIWLFAQHHAQDGDLSRFPSPVICSWIGWSDGPETLIDALVSSGWLDRNGEKLSIHDWKDHCPNWLKASQQKRNISETPSETPSQGASQMGSGRVGKGKARKGKGELEGEEIKRAFNEWYEMYPRKEAKIPAEGAFPKALARIMEKEHCSMLAAIQKIIKWTAERVPALKEKEPKFVPLPATWLNNGRFFDDLGPATQGKQYLDGSQE